MKHDSKKADEVVEELKKELPEKAIIDSPSMNNESQKLDQASSAASKSMKSQSHKTDLKASSHSDTNDHEPESAAVISKKSKHSA